MPHRLSATLLPLLPARAADDAVVDALDGRRRQPPKE